MIGWVPSHKTPYDHRCNGLLIAVALLVMLSAITGQVLGQNTASPEELVAQLMQAVSGKSYEQVDTLASELRRKGDAAVPAISAGLSQGTDTQRVYLVRAIGDGDAGTSLLVEIVGTLSTSPKSANSALAALENREVRRPLTTAETKAMTELVGQENLIRAGRAARVLAKCRQVSASLRVTPIVARYRSELEHPSVIGSVALTHMSPQAFARNQFLLAFWFLGSDAIGALSEARQRAAANIEEEKWWTIALGMTGYSLVAAELKSLVIGEPDKYTRALAVKAYTRSAKQEAIPLLESLLNDPTESDYGDCMRYVIGKTKLIQVIARDELARMRMMH